MRYNLRNVKVSSLRHHFYDISRVRKIHAIPSIPHRPDDGIPSLMSSQSLRLITELQRSYIRRINAYTIGTPLSELPLMQVITETEGDASHALLNYYASLAWNTDFWIQGINPKAEACTPTPSLLSYIESSQKGDSTNQTVEKIDSNLNSQYSGSLYGMAYEGGFTGLERMFKTFARAVLGAGFTWIISIPGNQLRILNTSIAGVPFFANSRSNSRFKKLTESPLLDNSSEKIFKQANSFKTGPNRENFEINLKRSSQNKSMLGSERLNSLAEIKSSDLNKKNTVSASFVNVSRTDDLFDNISQIKPLLALNMWEHAYLLDYGTDREAYIDASWRQINWNRIAILLRLY